MANAILILKLLLSIGPALIEFIKKLEEMMPESGYGAEKLALLKAYMESVWSALGTALPAFEAVWPKISAVVSMIVGWFNKKGVFTTSTSTTPTNA